MKKGQKQKEIVSRPVKERTPIKKALVTAGTKTLNKSAVHVADTPPRHSNFSFEEEAARFAHRSNMRDNFEETDELLNSVDLDPDAESRIEKIKRTMLESDEKEGWEAFYN